jgi:ankyrin repeat domain-containing protein 50
MNHNLVKEKQRHMLAALRARNSVNFSGPSNEPTQPADGTCQWIRDNSNYMEWRDNPQISSLLWITGGPGSGKSFLSDFIAKELKNDDVLMCKFSFTGGKSTPFDFLNYMISQALGASHELCHYAIKIWDTDDWTISFDSLWSFWTKICEEAKVGQIFWVIDALDECVEPHERKELLNRIMLLLQRSNRENNGDLCFRILLASRPEIWRELPSTEQESSRINRVILENESAIEDDIKIFIRNEVEMLALDGHIRRKDAQKLEDRLCQGADRTFIWPQLTLQTIKLDPEADKKTNWDIALEGIPENLEEIYEKLLSQLAANSRLTATGHNPLPPRTKKLLQFVLAAQGFLTVSELNILFSLESNPGTIIVTEKEAADIGPVVERVYGSFLRPVTDTNGVPQVRLFHETARKHLLLPASKSNYALDLADCHLELAKGCVSYLWLDDFGDIFEQFELGNSEIVSQKRQFLHYASLQWVYHVRESEYLMDEEFFEKVLGMYKTPSRRYSNWTAAFWSFSSGSIGGNASTPLQMCAYNGHARLLRRLLESIETTELQIEIDQTDALGNSALHYAAHSGRSISIKTLIEFKADATIRNTLGLTALHKAVIENEEEAVLAFLNGGVNVDSRTTGELSGRTVLHLAAESGLQKMVELLVEHGANIDILDSASKTAAKIAFDKGHGGISRFLDAKQLDSGITDLDRAIINGDEDRVRNLITAGASLSSKDNRGLTPLHRAARGRNPSILKFLLADTNRTETSDDDGRTPLHVAARYGQLATMQVLLSRHAQINTLSADGLTPLHEGVFSAKVSVVDRLLDAGGDQFEIDRNSRTPLFSASSLGYDKIVELFLRNARGNKVELLEDDSGHIPIHIAAENGHLASVEALLNTNHATIAREDRNGCTALTLAASGVSKNHAETVKSNTAWC